MGSVQYVYIYIYIYIYIHIYRYKQGVAAFETEEWETAKVEPLYPKPHT